MDMDFNNGIKLTDRENKLVVTKGEREGEEQIRGMALTDTNYYI